MNRTHHDLDPYPIPEDRKAMFINEPWIIPDGCSECFPFDVIEYLKKEYL
jgi:hypothetical protein